MKVAEEKNCRICGGELKSVLDLGKIYLSSFLKEDEKMSEDSKAPLVLSKCDVCGLVQLRHTIDLDTMYRQYWYASSLNKSMVSSLKDVVVDIESRITLGAGDKVLDIGCNDGTLLALYKSENLIKVGFDPALNLKHNGDFKLVNEYFSADRFTGIKAKVVTAIAMFYDLPDPNKFVEDVKNILHEDGIFVIQFTDLLSMIKVNAFDNICHEHLEYYTLSDVVDLLEAHELSVIDASYNDVNGGSLRVTASHSGRYISNNKVMELLSDEFNFFKTHTLETFKDAIEKTKFKIKEFLNWARFHNHTVYLMGASTKGNTLLQICEVTKENVPYAADLNKEKFGLRTVGSDITIISEEDALIKHPDYFLVPIWHFKKSLLSNPRIIDYMKSEGSLIFPLPHFHVVHLDYTKNIKEVRI